MVGLLVDNRLPYTEESNRRCCTSPGIGLKGLREKFWIVVSLMYSDGTRPK